MPLSVPDAVLGPGSAWPELHCLCQLPAAWARPVFLPRRRQPSLIQAGLWPAAGSLASFSGAVSDGVCSLRGVFGRPSKWASAHSLATVFLPCVWAAFPPAARVGLRCSPSLHASPFSLSVSVQRFHRALGVRLRPRSGARAECSVPPFHPRPRGHSSRVPLRPRRPVRCGRHSRGRREARFSSSFRCRHCRDESDDGLQAVYLLEQTLQVPLRF